MSVPTGHDFRLAQLALIAASGEATDEQLEELNQAISNDRRNVELIVDILSQDSYLSWHNAGVRKGRVRQDLAENICQTIDTSLSERQASRDSFKKSSQTMLFLAASMLLAIGAALGWIAKDTATGLVDLQSNGLADADVTTQDSYRAEIVHSTACTWNAEISKSLETSNTLRMGESLKLLQGLAKLQLDWRGEEIDLTVEGPAGLVLTAEYGASLTHGNFTVDSDLSHEVSLFETPLGTLKLSGKSSLGIIAAEDKVEVHVFQGAATFVVPWMSETLEPEVVSVGEGLSAVFSIDSTGTIQTVEAEAIPDKFVSKISMASSCLTVPQEYIDSVMEKNPAIYWRFTGSEDGIVRNEVSDRFYGRVHGSPELASGTRNQCISLGSGLTSKEVNTYVVTEELIDLNFDDGYTLEIWAKPSHYHWGTMVGMFENPSSPDLRWPHGLILELSGAPGFHPRDRVGKIRYLHRDPPSSEFNDGSSVYSQTSYALRKWQHIVAVKNKSQMKLYVDGQLVASAKDETNLSQGMKLLVGQVNEKHFYRRFVGQLDELAFYPQVLPEQEIRRHFYILQSQNQRWVGKTDHLY